MASKLKNEQEAPLHLKQKRERSTTAIEELTATKKSRNKVEGNGKEINM